MSERSDAAADPGGRPGRPAPVLGWRARLEAIQRAVMRRRLVAAGLEVSRAYDQAGGGMLAGGLSYFAFFTIVPSLLLLVSLLGVLVEDATSRARIIDDLVGQVDPLRGVATEVVNGLARSGRTGTIVGLIGLLWGASGFYGALQTAMQRTFPGPGARDFLHTRVRGVVAVVLVLGSMLVAVAAIVVVPLVATWLSGRCHDLAAFDLELRRAICDVDLSGLGQVLGPLGATSLATLAAIVVYVAIPTNGPSLRQALGPALLAGLGIGLLTSLFGLLAPLLVRQWLALGILGSAFVALVWLNLVFQALLYGAALARLRRDRDRLRRGPPRF